MRTTVTLDPDVEKLLKEESHRLNQSFKKVLNETIRKSLRPVSLKKPEILPGKPLGLAPGIDYRRLNQIAEDFDL